MTTPAEQEAERRYPKTARMRFAFESGAAFERELLWELLEAAREYRDGKVGYLDRLLAAAAALEEA